VAGEGYANHLAHSEIAQSLALADQFEPT